MLRLSFDKNRYVNIVSRVAYDCTGNYFPAIDKFSQWDCQIAWDVQKQVLDRNCLGNQGISGNL